MYRIELLQRDLVAMAFEETADGGGGEAFAERRDDAARDEDVLDGTLSGTVHGHALATSRASRWRT